jgi:hypothetical protein
MIRRKRIATIEKAIAAIAIAGLKVVTNERKVA